VNLNEPSKYNHAPSVINSEVRLFLEKIRSRAIHRTESTQQVMDQYFRDVTDQMVARLPNFKHVKTIVQRQHIVNDLLLSLVQVTPTVFSQLYTGHDVNRNAVFNLIFTSLSDKQQPTYEKLINQ
jgi:hypothetical protein